MKNCTFFLFSSLLIIASPAFGQTFKETMIEFKKLEEKTRSGINLSKYIESLASVDYAVDAYKSEADDSNNENKIKFQSALDKYKSAANAWQVYNAGKVHGVPETFNQNSQKYCPNTRYYTAGGYDNFDKCISEIWGEASEIISTAVEVKKENKINIQKNKTKN